MVRKKRAPSKTEGETTPKRGTPAAKPESWGKHYVGIDYPQEGEILTSSSYVIRVSTSATQGVEISIDGKDWQPCRESVGFWWYDWSGYGAGAHTLSVRIPVGRRSLKSRARSLTALN